MDNDWTAGESDKGSGESEHEPGEEEEEDSTDPNFESEDDPDKLYCICQKPYSKRCANS